MQAGCQPGPHFKAIQLGVRPSYPFCPALSGCLMQRHLRTRRALAFDWWCRDLGAGRTWCATDLNWHLNPLMSAWSQQKPLLQLSATTGYTRKRRIPDCKSAACAAIFRASVTSSCIAAACSSVDAETSSVPAADCCTMAAMLPMRSPTTPAC